MNNKPIHHNQMENNEFRNFYPNYQRENPVDLNISNVSPFASHQNVYKQVN